MILSRRRVDALTRIESRLDVHEAWKYAVKQGWFREADAMYPRVREFKRGEARKFFA